MPQIVQDNTLIGDIIEEWEVKEYEHYPRPRAWYVIMGTGGALLILYSIITGNLLFSAIIILSGIILFLQDNHPAEAVPVAITDLGVVVGNRFYPYKELESFFIVYQPPEVKVLFIKTKSALRPMLRISLLEHNPVDIRSKLRKYMNEDLDQEEEPTSDKLARWWQIH